MVWGMILPSGFGEFWPLGQFEGRGSPLHDGWGERLKDHYRAQMPKEQKALFDYVNTGQASTAHWYPGYVSRKFISESGTAESQYDPPSTPIKSYEAPRFFQTEKAYKSLGSLIKLNDRIVAVDEGLKKNIERLEPGSHQFFPIEIRMLRAKIYPGKYYTLAIGQYFDSFSPEDSKEGSFSDYGPDYPNHYKPPHTKMNVTGLALSRSAFGKAHLWRERGFGEWLTCFSDELVAATAEAGLRIPKHYRMKEV